MAGSGGPPGAATLVIENQNPAGNGGGLYVHSTGGACVGTYGQLGATAISAVSNDGLAIEASGRVSFDYAGFAVVAAGESSVRLKLASGNVYFPEGALILATLQGDAGPGVAVRSASRLQPKSPEFEAIQIVLTAAAARDVSVAFWVFYTPPASPFVPA